MQKTPAHHHIVAWLRMFLHMREWFLGNMWAMTLKGPCSGSGCSSPLLGDNVGSWTFTLPVRQLGAAAELEPISARDRGHFGFGGVGILPTQVHCCAQRGPFRNRSILLSMPTTPNYSSECVIQGGPILPNDPDLSNMSMLSLRATALDVCHSVYGDNGASPDAVDRFYEASASESP